MFFLRNYISPHQNKKAKSPFYHEKIFLIENETPIGCLTFIFFQKYFFMIFFYNNMDLRLFYFDVTIFIDII